MEPTLTTFAELECSAKKLWTMHAHRMRLFSMVSLLILAVVPVASSDYAQASENGVAPLSQAKSPPTKARHPSTGPALPVSQSTAVTPRHGIEELQTRSTEDDSLLWAYDSLKSGDSHDVCDLQGFASKSDSALAEHIRSMDVNCVNSLFSAANITIRSRAFRMANMVAVSEHAEQRAISYAPPDEVLEKYYLFLRAGYYNLFYNADDLDWSGVTNRLQVDQAVVSALTAFVDNQHFYDVSDEHAPVLQQFLYITGSAEKQSDFLSAYKKLLQQFDEEYLNHPRMADALETMLDDALRRALLLYNYRELALEDSDLVDALRDLVLSDWALGTSVENLLRHATIELARFLDYSQATIYPRVVSAVQEILDRYGYVGEGYRVGMATLDMILRLEKCQEFSVCGVVNQLAEDVFPIRHECDGISVVVRAQDLTEQKQKSSCEDLVAQERTFHEKLITNRIAVSDDYNEELEIVVYDSYVAYDTYSTLLFGNSTDNGGIYIEGDPSDPENQARVFVYREGDGIRNFQHEHVHYLDGRFNMYGPFANYRVNTHNTVWWAEGLAEYVSLGDDGPWWVLAVYESPALSTIFETTYSSGVNFVYRWSYLGVRFFFEKQFDELSVLLDYFRSGRYDDYLQYLENDIGDTYDQEFSDWLARRGGLYCYANPRFYAYSYISRVSFSTLDNATGSSGYSEHRVPVRITRDSTQTLLVEVDAVNDVGDDTHVVAAWVDWNENREFDDSEKLLNQNVILASGPVEVSGSISAPKALVGTRRMRVKVNYDSGEGIDDGACGAFESGEVEDYDIEIVVHLPSRPEGLVVSPGDGRATLSWADPSDTGITGYEVRHATDAGAFTGATPPAWAAISGGGAATVEHTVEGLTNGLRYYFQLRATSVDAESLVAAATVQLAASPSAVVVLDAPLAAVVARALDKGEGEAVTQLEMAGLRELRAGSSGISDLAGLERAVNVESMDLAGNRITDLGALSTLEGLRSLRLANNALRDISPLSGLSSLEELWLNDNAVSDLSPLAGLASLVWLEVARNEVRELPPLEGLTALKRLRLDGNRVTDLAALVESGFGKGSVVGLRGNPLSSLAIERHLPALRAAGVAVLAGWPVPLFPAAADPDRQGFVRVVNRSSVPGDVLIEAVDDAGVRRGPVRLAVSRHQTTHFNSDDLEAGNEAKGLSEGVGAPTEGAWRLALVSSLDIEVFAYARTPDGFLTSVHDMLRRDDGAGVLRAPVFNPGGNSRQRSSLLLSNPGAVDERVSVSGVDDAGGRRDATGLVVPAGGAVAVSAVELESGGFAEDGAGLGDGQGKWRLVVDAPWPVEAASLLASPSGHLTNLSTAPAAGADGVWRAPFFPAAANESGWQGFARVANRSGRAGEVSVVAVDDAGVRAGPARLGLAAGVTVHFNSGDLERGNAAKGLPAGVGPPTRGDWRLELTSALDLAVASYIRTSDGFLTSMHDVAPRAQAGGARRVVVFNPGGNERQASRLRLINDGDVEAAVVVTGVDDAGQTGGEVRLSVPVGQALGLTAAELESGADAFEGALGDGTGKWRLSVAADESVSAMSLLSSATGHLTNLSSMPLPWRSSVYCHAEPRLTSSFYISRVSLGPSNDPTGSLDNQTGSNGYSLTRASSSVASGSTQTLRMEVNTTESETNRSIVASAWIDWNADRVFDDSERVLNQAEALSDEPVEVSQSFSVPSDVGGIRRMRVKVNYNWGRGSNTGACNIFESGEVEDYEIEITDSPSPRRKDFSPSWTTPRWHGP